jgi:small-conductance mechanosensitive channel
MNHRTLPSIFEGIDIPLFDLGGRTLTLGTVLVAGAVIVGSYIFSALVRRGLARLGGEQRSLHSTERLAHYLIVGIGFSVALQTAGIDLRALFTAGAVFAVGVGFAMQNVMQNFVSGIILLVERSIRPGDVLDIEGRQVRVVEMGIRSTWVRSRDDEVLIVPNSTLVQATVRSYTLLDSQCRVRISVGVAYSSDMQLVRETLCRAAERVAERNRTKDPLVLLIDFSPSSVEWEVSMWIDDPWLLRPAGSALRQAVWESFREKGIRIACPQLDLHLAGVDEGVVSALSSRAA